MGTGGPAAQSPGGEGIPHIWALGTFATATLAGADAHLCRGDLESGEKAGGEGGAGGTMGSGKVFHTLTLGGRAVRAPFEEQGQVVKGAPERWD